MRRLILAFFMLSCSLCCAEDFVSKTESISPNLYSGTSCVAITSTLQPQSLSIFLEEGKIIIYFDGRVEIIGVTLDDAVREFWKKVSDAYPVFKENILIKEREKQALKKESNGCEIPVGAKPYKCNLDTGIYVDYRR